MKHLRLTLFLALLVSAVVAVPTVGAQEAFVPVFEEADCVFPVPEALVMGEDLICGYVEVPELHANPDGPTIRLAVAVIKSTGDTPAPDPLAMFTGGPGANVFPLAGVMFSSPVRADRDVVLFSERGTYGAEPFLGCPEVDAVNEGRFGTASVEIDALKLDGFAACRERLVSEGVNLSAYNNPERVADLPVVMEALGYDAYNIWGVSGGGLYTQYALRQNPAGIRTIMTDSGAFPTAHFEEVFGTLINNQSNAYRLLFEVCAADAVCNENYPELEAVFLWLVDELNANPVPLTITHPLTGEEAEIMLTGDMVVAMLSNSFASVASLPNTIYALVNGDYSFMIDQLPYTYLGAGGEHSLGLYQSVACSEIGHMTMDDVVTDVAYPQLVQALSPTIQNVFETCAIWDVESVPAGEVVVSDDVPILIMEGVYDTNKPPELGAVVAENFSTSYLVEFPDKAHVTLGSCALAMMAEFMNDPSQAPDMGCVAEGVDFMVPGGDLTFSPVTLETMGISTVAPDGWIEVAEAIWARGNSPADQTVLLFMALPGDDVETAVTAMATAEGYDAPTALEERSINDRTWTVYLATKDETSAIIAGFAENNTVYLTTLIMATEELASAESIMLPVLEAFIIAE